MCNETLYFSDLFLLERVMPVVSLTNNLQNNIYLKRLILEKEEVTEN